jgi:hypothetical protein
VGPRRLLRMGCLGQGADHSARLLTSTVAACWQAGTPSISDAPDACMFRGQRVRWSGWPRRSTSSRITVRRPGHPAARLVAQGHSARAFSAVRPAGSPAATDAGEAACPRC